MARPSVKLLLVAVVGGLGACQDQGGTEPEPISRSQELRGRALAIDIDLTSGTAKARFLTSAGLSTGSDGPSFALFGRNEISATVTNLTRSAVGEFTPLRVRVRFDLSLTNTLVNSDLVPSTFPLPPTGVNEVVAFPFATTPAGLFGLKVRASTDWDGTGASGSGAPHNFFNDAICIGLTPPSDCFRWEGFGPQVNGGASTAARRVGFDVDPSVASFTVYVVVAADIKERPPQQVILLSENSVMLRGGVGGPPTPPREIQVTSSTQVPVSGLAVSIGYGANGSGWLSATLSSTTTPATLTLRADPEGLSPFTDPSGFLLAQLLVTAPGALPDQLGITFQVVNMPDLTFTGTPAVAAASGFVTVTNLMVINAGTNVAGPFNVAVCLSTSDAIADCVGDLQAGSLRPSLSVSATDAIPALQIRSGFVPPITPGTYHVFAIVDPPFTAMVEEADETNNVLDIGTVDVP
jgi:hypothetical protein